MLLDQLPEDILLSILGSLEPLDILGLRQVRVLFEIFFQQADSRRPANSFTLLLANVQYGQLCIASL